MMQCSPPSKLTMERTGKHLKTGSTRPAEMHDFRSEIIKKLTGVVCQVVMACDSMSDDDLLTSLRTSFSDAPTMNQAQEDLRNLRQGDNKSIMVYIYKWGCALVRSSGISAQNETHPHIIKDFISSPKKSIRNKIANMGGKK